MDPQQQRNQNHQNHGPGSRPPSGVQKNRTFSGGSQNQYNQNQYALHGQYPQNNAQFANYQQQPMGYNGGYGGPQGNMQSPAYITTPVMIYQQPTQYAGRMASLQVSPNYPSAAGGSGFYPPNMMPQFLVPQGGTFPPYATQNAAVSASHTPAVSQMPPTNTQTGLGPADPPRYPVNEAGVPLRQVTGLMTAADFAKSNQSTIPQPPAEPKRASKRILIVDPATNAAVDIPAPSDAKSESSTVATPPSLSREDSRVSESESNSGGPVKGAAVAADSASEAEKIRAEFALKITQAVNHGPSVNHSPKEVSGTSSRSSPAPTHSSDHSAHNGPASTMPRKFSNVEAPGDKPPVDTEITRAVRSRHNSERNFTEPVAVQQSILNNEYDISQVKPDQRFTDPGESNILVTAPADVPDAVETEPQETTVSDPPSAEENKADSEEVSKTVNGIAGDAPNEDDGDDIEDDKTGTVSASGRVVYSRDALLSFEVASQKMQLTPNWINQIREIVRRADGSGGGPQQNRNDNFGRPPPGGGGGGGQRKGDYGRYPSNHNQPQVIKLTLTQDEFVPPPSNENAWKPGVKKEKVVASDEASQNEEIFATIRALLNKLTPNNYDKLSAKMMDVPFTTTSERLTGTVDLIFEKALEELNYAELYAKLCCNLITVETKDAEGKPVKVRTVLLQRAQRYFEKTDKEELEAAQAGDKPDADPLLLAERRAKAKRHYLGNIRFISELFKIEMLTDKVILSCFHKLLPKKPDFSDADEEKLECLCKLLMTCAQRVKAPDDVQRSIQKRAELAKNSLMDLRVTGTLFYLRLSFGPFSLGLTSVHTLEVQCQILSREVEKLIIHLQIRDRSDTESPQAEEKVGMFFDMLKKMIDSKVTSSRIRFLMQDAIDLKNSNYVARKNVIPANVKPKTINEIHAEKRQEEQDIKQAVMDLPPMPRGQQLPMRGGMQGQQGRGLMQSGMGLPKPKSVPGNLANMGRGGRPGALASTDTGNPPKKFLNSLGGGSGQQGGVVLGPAGQNWSGGSGSLRPASGVYASNVSRLPENKSASSSRESSASRMDRREGPRKSLTLTSSRQVESSLLENTSLNTPSMTPSITPVATPVARSPVQEEIELDDENLEKATNHMIAEITKSEDGEIAEVTTEAVRNIRRWGMKSRTDFAKFVLIKFLEAKRADQPKILTLWSEVARDNLLSPQVLLDSVGGTVEATDDIVVDVPNMYDYVVEFIGPLILDSLLSLDLVNDIFKRSSDHESKYHGAFQKWINVPDRLSSQKKEELLNKEPAEWGKVFPPADEALQA